jgi:hypothetical protein
MLPLKFRLLPGFLLLILANPSQALDAKHPDPLSVVAAAFATQNVGNVDAATAFYMDDALITNTRGKATLVHTSTRRTVPRTCSSVSGSILWSMVIKY